MSDASTGGKATRQSRSSKRRKLNVVQASSSYMTQSPNASQTGVLAQQVARPDPARIKGRRGHLKFMTKVPLDVLHEIFSELDPIDLLHLSWSCKNLHAIVMSKSEMRLWESAFARLYESDNPPPRRPDDLNPAQYTRFLFVNKCMDCGTRAGRWDSWGMRLRVCWHCLRSSRFTRYGTFDYNSNCKYDLTLPRIKAGGFYYYRSSQCNEVRAPLDYTYLRERHERKIKDQHVYDRWKSCPIKAKQENIFNRLRKIGWYRYEIEEIAKHKIDRLPGFARSKSLTDKEWDTIQPRLVDRLKELRRVHEEQIKGEELSRRYRNFENNFSDWRRKFGFPWAIQAVDLAVIEPFKSALFAYPSKRVEIGFSVGEINRVAKKWVHSPYNFLLSLLPPELRDSVPAEPKTGKGSIRSFPASLMFRSQRNPSVPGRSSDLVLDFVSAGRLRLEDEHFRHSDEPELSASLALVTPKIPWEWARPKIAFYPKAHKAAKRLLTLLEEDPNSATLKQLDKCKSVSLICGVCHYQYDGYFDRLDYFRSAVAHDLNGHKGRRNKNKRGVRPCIEPYNTRKQPDNYFRVQRFV